MSAATALGKRTYAQALDPPESPALHAERQTLESILDPAYWDAVEREARLSAWERESESGPTSFAWNADRVPNLSQFSCRFHDDGYHSLGLQLSAECTHLLRDRIMCLDRLGWDPVWILMYDEVWHVALAAERLLQQLVSPALKLNMDFWAWCLHPEREERGWGPHRDRIDMPFDDTPPVCTPHYVTIWIALTDATPLNGCIYVVPARWDPSYRKTGTDDSEWDVQDARAVPCSEATALCWTGRLVHWGGRCDRHAAMPRVALSIGFAFESFDPASARLPNVRTTAATGADAGAGQSVCSADMRSLPTLRERLQVIAVQSLTYEHRVPLRAGVRRILDELEDEAGPDPASNAASGAPD